jgi:integrase
LKDQVKPVPITPPMLAVLKEMQRRRKDDAPDALVFPSPRGGAEYQLSTCSQFIVVTLKWEAKVTVHGFRSTFVDWARTNGFQDYLYKLQLDHVLGNKVGQAYGHNKLVEERRAMMRQWGDYCSRPAPELKAGKVFDLSSKRKRRST